MITREDVATFAPPRELGLKSSPNWTAVIFFAILAILHFCVVVPAFYHHRWEGYMSLIFGTLFTFAAVTFSFSRYEMAFLSEPRKVRLRHRVGPFRYDRFVPFADVHAIRLTLSRSGRHKESRIEILCDNEDLDCPTTPIARQQALFLAILMNVELIKVTDGNEMDHSDRTF